MEERKENRHHHFVLVHGACHGAWCWYKVAARLRSDGHRVTVLDMAASGIHRKSVEQLGCFAEYNEPLSEFMAALPSHEAVVLVGHSKGGVNISLAMERFPSKITVAVFVTAFMYGPTLSFATVKQQFNRQLESYLDSRIEYTKGEDNKRPVSPLFGPEMLQKFLYHLSPLEDLTLAKMLVREAPMFEDSDGEDEYAVTDENYGSVRRVYVVCGEDKTLKEEYQRWLIHMNPTDDVCFIPNADHMPMFSQPHQLCSSLQLIADKYNSPH